MTTIQIRDAVIAALVAAPLTPELEPIAIYDLDYGLEDLLGGRLTVMPQTNGLTLLARSKSSRSEPKIDVAVQYKYVAPTTAEVDPYLTLAESIAKLVIGMEFGTPVSAVCNAVTFPHGLFLQQHIEKFGVFTSVITLEFISLT